MRLPPIQYYIGLSPSDVAKLRQDGMMDDLESNLRNRLQAARHQHDQALMDIQKIMSEARAHEIQLV